MSLLLIEDDPWLLEYESCEKLYRDIMEQLTLRQKYSRTSDKYSQISVTIRLRLKQFHNEVGQLKEKLEIANRSDSITTAEAERRLRQVEALYSKGLQMQKLFEDQGMNKYNEDRRNLMGAGSSWYNDDGNYEGQTVDTLRDNQKRMLGEQETGLENLSQIISRQKNIAQTISNEVDFHNEILDDLGNQMDRTDYRVRNETQHISTVATKDKTCVYWVVIILLFISIIAVAAI